MRFEASRRKQLGSDECEEELLNEKLDVYVKYR